MLHNTKLNRWHPVLFDESPLPGPPEPGKPVRHKSKMHHTEGYDSREVAIREGTKKFTDFVPGVRFAWDEDSEWDGESIPAQVAFFTEETAN
jgi:hypothetical protein